jgi:MGT family glycosyltransferase
MLDIARELVNRGHHVTVLTGSRFEQRATAAGASFVPLSGRADFDDRDVPSYLPDQEKYRGLARAQYDIQTIFVRTIPEQYRAVARVLADGRFDAILVDAAFGGVSPLLHSPDARPPILAVGVTPLTQLSRDTAPSGMGLPPSSSPLGRMRNVALNTLARRVLFRDTQNVAEQMAKEVGAPPLDYFAMDLSREFDVFLQLGPIGLEYPRSDISPNVEFVGVVPAARSDVPAPSWWGDLDGSRPVVHVTQGTIDNRDFGRLVRPTLDALAEEDVLVVVSTGGRPARELGAVPANARVAEYLSYPELLPLTDVMITNGGFGGVQHALAHGVPLVVAGDTEDKPEVAARVAWARVGVNLKTGQPDARAVRLAVKRVLDHPEYRVYAQAMAKATAGYATVDLIEAALT